MSDAELRDADKLVFVLEHEGPIPLAEFTSALQRLAMRYTREVKASEPDQEPRLYISEITKGSVVIAFVAAGAIMTGLGGANTLFTFAQNLKKMVGHFTGKGDKITVTKADCDDMRALASPVIHTVNGGIHLHIGRDALAVLELNQAQAFEADNRAALERMALSQQEENLKPGVLLVWDQVRNAPGVEVGRSPDRGVIFEIDKRPRQVTFASDELKTRMGWHGFNPFDKAFVVDVKVMVGPGGPLAYRVLALHDVLDRE